MDELLYDISSDFNVLSLEEIQQKFEDKFSREAIKRAWNTLYEKYTKDGHLSDIRPQNRADTFAWEGLNKSINDRLRQIVLNCTDNCNLRCEYCIYSGKFTGKRTHNKKMMTKENAKQVLDYLLEHSNEQKGFTALGFYGGEPFLNFDLIKWSIEYVKENYIQETPLIFTITSNGTNITQEIIEFLIKNNVILFISLDGPEEVHDKNRKLINGEGSYKKVISNLERIKDSSNDYYKTNVRFSSVLSGGSDYLELDNFFTECGLPVRISSLESFGAEKLDQQNPFINQISNYRLMKEKFIKGAISNSFNENKTPNEYCFVKNLFENTMQRIHRRYPCRDLIQDPPGHSIRIPGASRIFVSTDGIFYPCEKVEGNKNMRIGDIVNGVDIGAVKRIIWEYYNFIHDECKNCWLIRMCNACFVHAVHNDDFNLDKFRYNCQLRRKVFHEALSTYLEIAVQNPDSFGWLERDELDNLLEL